MNYNQICLVPEYGVLKTRSDADVECEFAGRKWKLPVVPSNMLPTINFELAEWMSDNNYFYILHRFYLYYDIWRWVKHNQHRYVSITVGVQENDRDLIEQLVGSDLRVDCVTIDVAHGFSVMVEDMCKFIKETFPQQPFIIAGNVFGDRSSIQFLEDCGVDAIKVGLAFGKACTTYNETGFASPMFSCGLEASRYTSLPLIGDGGIRESGDITKALVAGYDMVMAGSIFAQCLDSPAPLTDNGNKIYFGSASERAKRESGQEIKHIEGKTIEVPCNNLTYRQMLAGIEQNLKSSVSYAGGTNLKAFNKVKWILIEK